MIEINQVLFPGKPESDMHEQRWIAIRTDGLSIGLVVQAAR
ncbi:MULTISPECIES: hypothetical protein [unclassified Peribacillus]|nr:MULTISPECIES: hypothetical protein [unclassified Peribacillus]